MPELPKIERADDSRVEKPWGYEIRWAITDRYLGKILHVNEGEALSLQYHERKDEYLYVVSGCVEIETGGSEGSLAKHQMRAIDAQPDRRSRKENDQHNRTHRQRASAARMNFGLRLADDGNAG